MKNRPSKKTETTTADDSLDQQHHLFTKPIKCPQCGGNMDEAGESDANWFDICKKCGSVFYYQSK
jgi:tRNA(Ile2) C34 agmatinyltransferase TiaS